MTVTYEMREAVGLSYLLGQMTPQTPYGAEHVRRPRFFAPQEREALEVEWQNVAVAAEGLRQRAAEYDRLAHVMMQMRDVRGTLRRLDAEVLTEVELFELKRFLLQLLQLVPLFVGLDAAFVDIGLTMEEEALAVLDPQGRRNAGFAINGAADEELKAVQEEKARLEAELRAMPEGPARDEALNRRRLLIAQEEAGVLRARVRLTEALRPFAEALSANVAAIGRLDYAIERAKLAIRHRMARPAVSEGEVHFAGMTAPHVAAALEARGRAYTPVSIDAPVGATVITGANMGGKSIALKTLVLNVLLCQAGFFACAKAASLPLFDEVYVVGDDLTDVDKGLSSFGAEVVRLQEILEAVQGGAFCLVALDEPARGTNPQEGAALVRALVRRFAGLSSVAVVATHYEGVARGAQAHYQAAGLDGLPAQLPQAGDRLAFVAGHMNYGLVRVAPDAPAPQEALSICRLLGLDAQVVADMEEGLRRAKTE